MNNAIIFDLDELLVDSRQLWRTAETTLFRAMGHEYDLNVVNTYKGMNAFDVTKLLYDLFKPNKTMEYYLAVIRESLDLEYETGEIIAMPGAVELVCRLKGFVPMAIASGSPLNCIKKAAGRLGLEGCFTAIISSESVAKGKPAPDVFLKAGKMLGAFPQQCIVFEDSFHGVQAGMAAGMKVFAVPSTRGNGIERLATRTFSSLAEVTLADISAELGQ